MTTWKNAIVCLGLLTMNGVAQDKPATPQQAQVTFYTIGLLRGSSPFADRMAFKGSIFDSDRRLALLQPGSFITFKMNAGEHVFRESGHGKEADRHVHLDMDLTAGEHYFVGVFVETSHVVINTIHLEPASCEDAQKIGIHTKPLDPRHLEPDGAPLALSEPFFPHCS
jgi:hypothetical protein